MDVLTVLSLELVEVPNRSPSGVAATKRKRAERRAPATGPEGVVEGRPKGSGPGTFDLLGFTHYWGMSRRGKWVVHRRTAKDRFRRALKRVADWCRKYRHYKVRLQQQALVRKLQGHYQYYGITGNYDALKRFHNEAKRVWRKWLNRRSQRARMTWEKMTGLLKRYPLPTPRITRPLLPRPAKP